MEAIAYIIGSSLPMGLFIFVGSYFGIWKRRESKLPLKESILIFIGLWVLALVLIITFRILLSGQDELIQSTVGGLWGPLIVGVIIGRSIVDKRHIALRDNLIKKSYEADDE